MFQDPYHEHEIGQAYLSGFRPDFLQLLNLFYLNR